MTWGYRGQMAQCIAPGMVSKTVVDTLEVVNVDCNQATLSALRFRKRLIRMLDKSGCGSPSPSAHPLPLCGNSLYRRPGAAIDPVLDIVVVVCAGSRSRVVK